MTTISYGPKYDANLSTVQIAKAFRADVKAALKAGELPAGLQLSVRAPRHSSIQVEIVASPVRVLNPARLEQDRSNPYTFVPEQLCPRFTAEASALLEQLTKMLNAYNYDGSDTSVDYFNVRFYGSVRFDWKLEELERAAAVAGGQLAAAVA